MLLTLKPPQGDPGDPNEYTVIHKSHPSRQSSPQSESSFGPEAPSMASSHLELPRPSSLPRVVPAMPTSLPPPPATWQGSEHMKQWLQAKIEEDRRSQEEEKTRQETLRLEQRKIEQTMLQDSLRAGVPSYLVPLIFASMNGGTRSEKILDLLQQYAPQPPQSAPPRAASQQSSFGLASPMAIPSLFQLPAGIIPPEAQRDFQTMISNIYGMTTPQATSNDVPAQQPVGGAASYPPATGTSVPRVANIPRNAEGNAQDSTSSVCAMQQICVSKPSHSTPVQHNTPRRPSPSISFHHWVPPGQPQPQSQSQPQAKPQVTSTRGQTEKQTEKLLPSNVPAPAHGRSESQTSPSRKRKSQSAHRQNPAPSTRSSGISTRSSRSARNSQDSGTFQSGAHEHSRWPTDVSSSHESRGTVVEPSDQPREAPRPGTAAHASVKSEQLKVEEKTESPAGNIKAGDTTADREAPSQLSKEREATSGTGNATDPSQHTRINTRSGGTARKA
ncbi:uncharacterized protein N7459_000977 [Penicillium hispanicum]|uniref:uncharacterized protein n=1 Tax=Penicillium hispanicum TaxID=1080232 RepID=UPI0025424D1A|nr:uncharacterized protein N7459_000977 [Penicillium hispanicum]KAJ5594769.1 hypothetical protein N7459_000977 [Penicillium hispanicum]